MIILQGYGGDGKSAYSVLRDKVFSDSHYYVSPSVFQKEDEFRRQGSSYSSARVIKVQGCNGGSPLQEFIIKKIVGGEKIGCRKNYGKETEYFSWEFSGKTWEMNNFCPRSKGDPNNINSLKSWTRRLIVCEMESNFSSNKDDVDLEKRIFEEDTDLTKILSSKECRKAYINHQLLPFMRSNSPKRCTDILNNPGNKIQNSTMNFVKQMAGGGSNLQKDTNELSKPIERKDSGSISILESIHEQVYPSILILKTFKLQRMSNISNQGGTYSKGSDGKVKKENYGRVKFIKSERTKYPYIFKFNEELDGFDILNVDWKKLRYICLRYNFESIGSQEHCGVVWDIKQKIYDFMTDVRTSVIEIDDFAMGMIVANKLYHARKKKSLITWLLKIINCKTWTKPPELYRSILIILLQMEQTQETGNGN